MERMISGIKPSGNPTLGNYLGAIQPFIKYQDQYDLYVFVADLHALTIHQEPKVLQENIDALISIYLAAGLDPNKCTIFRQSDIPAHNQLEWVLTCNTNLGDLTKMPQYKNYLEQHKGEATPTGMLMYPSLMNADILLYDAEYVPTGIDQVPHVELTRDVAETFNKRYGEIFTIPKSVVTSASKIMSLSDPTKKMSKSESDKGTIYLLDDIEVSKKKIMKALTDSDNTFRYDPVEKPGLSNLIVIYSCLANCSISEVVNLFVNAPNYGTFKRALAELLGNFLSDFQRKVTAIQRNKLYTEDVLKEGRTKASRIATQKINQVYKQIGL